VFTLVGPVFVTLLGLPALMVILVVVVLGGSHHSRAA
jgi:hypothetical protein